MPSLALEAEPDELVSIDVPEKVVGIAWWMTFYLFANLPCSPAGEANVERRVWNYPDEIAEGRVMTILAGFEIWSLTRNDGPVRPLNLPVLHFDCTAAMELFVVGGKEIDAAVAIGAAGAVKHRHELFEALYRFVLFGWGKRAFPRPSSLPGSIGCGTANLSNAELLA